MTSRRYQRRGVTLVIAVMMMGVVAWLLAGLAMDGVRLHRQHRYDRLDHHAAAVADSVEVWARAQRAGWSGAVPDEAIALDVSDLVPEPLKASATIDFPLTDGRRYGHIRTHVESDVWQTTREREIPLD